MSNMIVNTNVLSLNSHRALKQVGVQQSKASARLSSGLKINSAADDAAGLAISEKMRSQIRGLDMASKNSQDAISLIQTAEGGMQEIDNMVQRIRELVVQAANDSNEYKGSVASASFASRTLAAVGSIAAVDSREQIGELGDWNYTPGQIEVASVASVGSKSVGSYVVTSTPVNAADRQKIQDEINALVREIDAMANRTEFNKKKVISGDFSSDALHFQVGANAGQNMTMKINSAKTDQLSIGTGSGITNNINVLTTGAGITPLLATMDAALTYVTTERSKLGAAQNRLEYTIKSLDVSSENLSAAESRIRDTDMAKEMMSLTKANVLQQAASSMLAQANQAPQSVLQLLQ